MADPGRVQKEIQAISNVIMEGTGGVYKKKNSQVPRSSLTYRDRIYRDQRDREFGLEASD